MVDRKRAVLKRAGKGQWTTKDGRFRLTLHDTTSRGRAGAYYWWCEDTTVPTNREADGRRKYTCFGSLDEARIVFASGVDPMAPGATAAAGAVRFA
jgi:hypothetical protein